MSAAWFAPVTLVNGFVRLEPLAERHRHGLRAAGDDPDLWRFASGNQHGRDFDAWMVERLEANGRGMEMSFAGFDKASGAVAGSTNYLAIVPAHRRLEIGWTWYQRCFWASAVNPACKRLLMAHGFEMLQLNRIELKLDATNARS